MDQIPIYSPTVLFLQIGAITFRFFLFSCVCSITLTCLIWLKIFQDLKPYAPIYRSEVWWSCSCCLFREGPMNIEQMARTKLPGAALHLFLCGVLRFRILEGKCSVYVVEWIFGDEVVKVNFVNRPLPWQVRLHGRSIKINKRKLFVGFGGDRTGIPGFSLWCGGVCLCFFSFFLPSLISFFSSHSPCDGYTTTGLASSSI